LVWGRAGSAAISSRVSHAMLATIAAEKKQARVFTERR